MLDPAGVESPQQEHPFLFHKAGTRPRSEDERHDAQNWETRMSYAFRAQTTARNYYNDDGDAHHASSGYSSPPLWKTTANGPTCGRRSPCPSPPRQQRNHYRSLSPTSRAQAIERGQQELMEMVKRMPESCYELSLKDLVEHPRQLEDHQRQQLRTESDKELERRDSQRRKSHDGGSMRRSGRAEENGSGMLLKMVFPVSFGSKRKAKKKKTVAAKNNKEHLAANTSNMTAKVSPKPSNLVAENGGSKGSHINGGGVDKEWWKKRYSVAGDQSSDQLSSSANSGSMKSSSGSRSSSNSSRSSSIRQGRGGGCWWFMRGKKKSKEEE